MDHPPLFISTLTGDQLTTLLQGIVRQEVRDSVRAELAAYKPPIQKALTLPEIANATQITKALDVTMSTVNNWTKARNGQPARLVPVATKGRHRLYRREDVLALIETSSLLKTKQLNSEGN